MYQPESLAINSRKLQESTPGALELERHEVTVDTRRATFYRGTYWYL